MNRCQTKSKSNFNFSCPTVCVSIGGSHSPLSVQFLSFSYSFWQKSCQIIEFFLNEFHWIQRMTNERILKWYSYQGDYLSTDRNIPSIRNRKLIFLYYLWLVIHCHEPHWIDTHPDVVINISSLSTSSGNLSIARHRTIHWVQWI